MHDGRPVYYKKHNPLFKNLITCDTCGGVVSWQLQKGRFYGACQRRNQACKVKKTIREDRLEATVVELLNNLVCPSPELIDWAVSQLKRSGETKTQSYEDSLESVGLQINRLIRMDADLYDDKLAGDTPKDAYQSKHASFMEQLDDLKRQKDRLESKPRTICHDVSHY